MRKEFVFVLMAVLMFSLVAGAGYNIVVPAADPPADPSPSGGGGSSYVVNVTSNQTANDTVAVGDDSDDDTEDGNVVTKTIGEAVDFVKSLGWKSIVLVLISLAIVGGAVWYFLKDRRKRFVEVKVKK